MTGGGIRAAASLATHDRAWGRAGLAAIFASVLVFGGLPFAIEMAGREIPAAQLTAARTLAVGLVTAVAIGPRRLLPAVRRHPGSFLLLSVVGYTLPHLCTVYALASAPVPTVTFITSVYPAGIILLAVLFLGERPSRRQLAGLACALAGLYLLTGAELRLGTSPAGIVFALLAAAGWSVAGAIGKRMTTTLSTGEIVAGRHVLAGVCVLPFIPLESAHVPAIGVGSWLALAVLIAGSLCAFSLYYWGLARMSLSTASVLESFIPVVTLVLGVLAFGQGLASTSLPGAALVLAGLVLAGVSEWSPKRAAPC